MTRILNDPIQIWVGPLFFCISLHIHTYFFLSAFSLTTCVSIDRTRKGKSLYNGDRIIHDVSHRVFLYIVKSTINCSVCVWFVRFYIVRILNVIRFIYIFIILIFSLIFSVRTLIVKMNDRSIIYGLFI